MKPQLQFLLASLTAFALAVVGCSGDGGDGTPSDAGAMDTGVDAPDGSGEDTSMDVDGDGADSDDDAGAGYVSEIYSELANWMCHPDLDEDLCDVNLDYTVVNADGSTEVVAHVPNDDPAVDCVYFYPTASADSAGNSDLVPGAEEIFVMQNQVAPLNAVCRVFAPTYRQVTLAALLGLTQDEPDREMAYADVLDAWNHYLANDNEGRGYILVGHSQGTGHLRRLIADEIEPDDAVHERMVAAYLLGGTIELPEGEDVGGSFAATPICRDRQQTGCFLSFASFRATAPPPDNSLFGRASDGNIAACNHPAGLDGSRAPIRGRFPTEIPGLFGLAAGSTASPWADPDESPALETDYFALPGVLEAGCTTTDEFSYLEVFIDADPDDPRADDLVGDLSPEWGLHLIDSFLVMNDLIDMAAVQAQAYSSR